MMDARAYVLIEAEKDAISAVLMELRTLPNIRTADVITGPFDIIVTVETPEQQAIGRLIMDVIHRIDGIKRTTTCVAIMGSEERQQVDRLEQRAVASSHAV